MGPDSRVRFSAANRAYPAAVHLRGLCRAPGLRPGRGCRHRCRSGAVRPPPWPGQPASPPPPSN